MIYQQDYEIFMNLLADMLTKITDAILSIPSLRLGRII